jgi:hypothetical protein
MQFGDYLVFVDESGDHGLAEVNRDFPLFALAFCVFPKTAYVNELTPAVRRLKVTTFGHDLVVLHEHDIRKKSGAFAMMSRQPREMFLEMLSRVIEAAPFTLLAVVIDKSKLRRVLSKPPTRITLPCNMVWSACSDSSPSRGRQRGSHISLWRRAASARTLNSNLSSAEYAKAKTV